MESYVKEISDGLERMGREFILEIRGFISKCEALGDVHSYDDGEAVYIEDFGGKDESTLKLKEKDILDIDISEEYIKIEMINNTYINFQVA